MDGKLWDYVRAFWDWHGYMSNTYANLYPFNALFDDEYDAMFTDLYLGSGCLSAIEDSDVILLGI